MGVVDRSRICVQLEDAARSIALLVEAFEKARCIWGRGVSEFDETVAVVTESKVSHDFEITCVYPVLSLFRSIVSLEDDER